MLTIAVAAAIVACGAGYVLGARRDRRQVPPSATAWLDHLIREALTAELLLFAGNLARTIALEAVGAVDVERLRGVDEAEVLRDLAVWRAELVADGLWGPLAEAAARVTLARHRALNAMPGDGA